jgi:hypothetical protein
LKAQKRLGSRTAAVDSNSIQKKGGKTRRPKVTKRYTDITLLKNTEFLRKKTLTH